MNTSELSPLPSIITLATVSFRQFVNKSETHETGYMQYQCEWLSEVYGCEDKDPTVQEIGSIETHE